VRCLRKTERQTALRLIWPLLLSLLFVAPSFGQTLTQVKITPSDTVAGNGTVYTVSFITSAGGTGLQNNGKIRLTFPAGFGVSSVSLAAPLSPPDGITSGFAEPVIAGQVVTLTRDGNGAPVPAGNSASFKMAVVINPAVVGKYSLLVETLTNADALIDSAPSDSFRIGVGPLAYVKVLNLAGGNTSEVVANTLTADQTLSMHAGGFDARGNYRGDVSVNWSVSGGIGSLSAASGVSTVFSANKVGNGQITADHPTPGVLDGATGNIIVVPGALAKVFVVAGTFGDGPQFGAHTMTTDQTLTVHAAGYDSDNNYIQDESVTWTVTGGIGLLSPTTGTTTTLDARTPGVGKINANHATLTDDDTDFITVNLGAPYRVKILSGLSGATAEVTTSALTAGGTLPVHASSFDADDNYISDVSVNWTVTGGIGSLSAATGVSTTLTAQTVGTGVINADHLNLIDDATGNITVSAGALAKVKVVQGTSGNGPQLGAVTLTTDNTITVHAAGYDANDNYVGDQVVTWSVSNGIGTVFPTIGTSTTLTLTTPGAGVITADHNTVTDGFSGTITVNVGSPYRVKVLTGASGNTSEVTAQTLTTGATLPVHAGSFDADGNYTGDVPVSWTVSGNIGTLSPGTGISTTLSATTPGSGAITADHASLIDGVSATISVAAGALSFVKVVEGPAGNGPELLAKTLTTDQNLTVHAAGYDAAGNYLGDFSVNWSLSNVNAGLLSLPTGAATTFNPTRTGTTTIRANHATATDDDTGTITITTGAAHHVKVLSGASGNTAEVTTQNLTAGSTFQVHASSFDADDNRIADVSVSWILSGGIGSLSPNSGVSTTLTASTAGTGIITADHSTLFDDATGIITVNAGALSFVKIVEGASGNGPEMGGKSLTTDNTLTVHAAGYDANGNYISDVFVNWSVTPTGGSGVIGALSPTTGTSTTLTLTTPGSGIITAAHATATDDDSGPISVSTGVAHHVKVLSGTTGNTAEVNTASLQVGNTLPVHAGSFDADDNYIADVSVTWNVTGGIGNLSSTVNTTTTLTAQKVGTGTIFADHLTLIDDATGAITVTAGPLAKVRIVEGESGNGPELLDKTVTTDQSITVHAAGYDAADNYLGDFSVNWTVSGGIGTFSTATGASTRLNLTTVGSGVINADHATVADDQSGTITVNAGNPHRVKILSGSNGNTPEVGAQTLTTGANLLVHAGSFDADDNYTGDVSVSWIVSGGIGSVAPNAGTTTTFTATTAGTGTIIADHLTLIDDATGLITVTTGALSYVKIVEGSSGNGLEVDTKNLTTDQTLILHAAGYDASNNYLGDFSVNWSVTDGIGVLSTNLGVTTTFDPRTPGTGTISADHPTAGVGDDVTGTITVTLGAPSRIKVLSQTSGNTAEVQTVNLTAGQTLDVHAGSYDADGNFTGDVSVAWSVSGGIGTLNPLSGITTRLTATTAGTGVITGDHATLIDDATGTITVTPGPLSFIKIVDGPSGNTAEVNTKSLTTDQTLTVHAAGYDASGNYLGDEPVTWSVNNNIGALSPTTGIATTLEANKPGAGVISADHATATDDVTGNITVAVGAPYRAKILSAAAGETPEVTNPTLLTGATLIVHAGSYDRDDNYINDVSVDWSVSGGIGALTPTTGVSTTFSATTVGTGVITAVNNTLIGDATGTITVQASTLNFVKIVEGASGNGPELTDRPVTTDQTITVHAAGYDASGNYLGDFSVAWSVTGGIGSLSATTGVSTTLDFKTPGTGQILANHATATDDLSGIFTVSAGAPHRVKVLDAASGATAEVTTRTLITGATLTVHASRFDADDNRIDDVAVDWRVTGGIGNLSALNGISTTLTATTPGSGVIIADHPTLIDDATGDIVVNAGALSYIKIVEGPAGTGPELTTKSLTTDQNLTVHAAGYDASNNYLGDQVVTWSLTGSNIGALSATTGLSTTLDARKPGVGQIAADHATATDDVTGNITVSVGAENRLKVLLGLSGPAPEVRDTTLTTGQTLPVHASSFDADDNRIQDVSVTWSATGNVGTLNPATGIGTTLTATKAGTGVIKGVHASLGQDATGIIAVNSGNLSFVKIVEGEAGNGAELGSKALTADQTLTVHAAGYDAAGNYLGDQPVTWSVTVGIGTLSTTTGTFTTLDARTPGSGVITADHATATDDNSGTITVTAGASFRIKILTGASGNTAEVTTATRSTGQTLVVHASSFDADDNYKQDESVAWSVSGGIGTLSPTSGISTTFTATKVGTGVITADHSTLIDDNTGLITVIASNLSFIKIVEGTAGNGPEVTTRSMTTDGTLTVHAAGYDANGNYLNDEPVTWSLLVNNLGTVSPATGVVTIFNPTRAGIERIIADHATATDDTTGNLTISLGTLHHVKVMSGSSGNSGEVTGATVVSGQTFVVHAAGFDADENYLGDFSVNWTVSGGIGALSSASGVSTILTARKVGNGQIKADHATALDGLSGTITVTAGPLAFIKVVEGPSGSSPELGARTMTTDQVLQVHAAGFDADTNYVGDQNVNWISIGTLAPAVSATGAASLTFSPTLAGASGTIRATHATAGFDETGTITVNTGALNKIKILSGLSGAAAEVGDLTVPSGQTLVVHAGGFDAKDNYIADRVATWSVPSAIGSVAPTSGTSTTFTAGTAGRGTIRAVDGAREDFTGEITVTTSSVAKIILRTAPGNGGAPFGNATITADDQITIHAAGYDAGNNYLGEVSVSWSSTNNLTPAVSATGPSFTFSPTLANPDGLVNGLIVGAFSPSIKDSTGTITVLPGAPVGNITLTPVPSSLAADGNATSTITSDDIKDADGNNVGANKLFTVAVNPPLGTIETPDASPLPGHQIATNAASRLSFIFKAGATGGIASITASGAGANGSTQISLGSLSIESITTSPTTVSQGQTGISVSMLVRNLSAAPVTDLSGQLIFTGTFDRTGDYTVPPLAPVTIAGGSTTILTFVVAVKSTAALETVTLGGTVQGTIGSTVVSATGTAQPDSWAVQRPANLTIETVASADDTVSQGQLNRTVTVRISNNAGLPNSATATVDSVRLVFRKGAADITASDYIITLPVGPATIPGNSSADYTFTVNVGAAATLGLVTIDARAYGKDANSNQLLSDLDAATKHNWTVVEGNAFRILSLTASQSRVTAGMTSLTREWSVGMLLENAGSSNISLNLDPAKTFIRFTIGNQQATPEYTIVFPAGLDEGGTVLAGHSTGHLTFRITRTGTTRGIATISGFAEGLDIPTNQNVTDNTNDGGTGEVTVQLPAVFTIQQLQLSQATVTQNMSKDWFVKAVVKNTGGADLRFHPSPDSLKISIGNNAGYLFSKPALFASRDSILTGGETDTLTVTVAQTGSSLGNQTVSLTLKGVELNSDQLLNSNAGAATVTVQSPAALEILSVRPSQPTVSVGQTNAWNVTVAVRNNGGSRVALKTDSTNLRFRIGAQFQNDYNVSLQPPRWLSSATANLAAGATDSLRFVVSATGSQNGFAFLWARVVATESNSDALVPDADNASFVQVQQRPAVSYIANSMLPDIVNNNTAYAFTARVRNDPNRATVLLDASRTKFRFNNGAILFETSLDANNPVKSIAPGDTTLTFASAVIPANMPQISYTPVIQLRGTENGNDFSVDLPVTTNELQVAAPAAVQILSVNPSQSTVTAGMAKPWNITATVRNNGGFSVRLDSVRLQLINGINVTADFGFSVPAAFLGSGNAILNAGATDSLRFGVTRTGALTGNTALQVRLFVTDQSNGQPIQPSPDGSGSVVVQGRADVRILNLVASRATVTRNQLRPWTVDMNVRNSGGSDVQLDFTNNLTRLALSLGGTIAPVDTLLSGGRILRGNAEAAIRFTISPTGSLTGRNDITGQVRGLELNSGDIRFDDTQDGGATFVTVQDSAKLRVKTVQLKNAPNLPFVNISQAFTADVAIENTGQEAADTVQVHLATAGLSLITPALRDIPTIAGGATRTVSFDITAASSENPAGEIFRASMTAGKARNTGATIIPAAPVDDTARAFIQRPAGLQITRVLTSETKVEAGRTLPWYIYAVVTNNSGATAVLNKPSNTNITVEIGGVPQIDYTIRADSVLRRNGTLALAANEIDTVRYTVLFTGAQRGGQASLLVRLGGRDKNNNAALSGEASGQIEVTTTATVQILATSPVVIRKIGELGFVNVNQTFGVDVTVQNISPFENVKDVLVRLTSNTGRSSIANNELLISSINTRESANVTFSVQADTSNPAGAQPETFTARIISALTPSDQPATISRAVDSTAQALVQRPAALSVAATISEPSLILSSNQLFDFTAAVSNSGQAVVNDSGEVTLSLPPGFAIEQPAPNAFVRRFTVNQPVVWKVRAPNQALTNVDLQAAISKPSKDLNIDAPAALGRPAATVTVTVVPTDLKINRVYVSDPPGAQDRTVSSGQTFRLSGDFSFSRDLSNTTAELRVPQPYRLVGSPAVQVLQDVVTWDVQAPAEAFEIPTFLVVRATGVDRSNVPVQRLDSLSVITVERAELNLTAQIIAPPGAVNGNLTFGQTFTLSATMQKIGRAGVIDTAKVTLELLNGFTTAEAAEKIIAVNGQAQWQVRAPNTVVNDSLTVRLTRRPLDENSNSPVALTSNRRFVRVPVRTDSSGYLRVLQWTITSPNGASDGIVSTRQQFVVQAEIEGRRAERTEAVLRLPAGFNTTQNLLQNLNELNGRTFVRWAVQAPSGSSFGRKDTVRVEVTGADKFSGQAIPKQRSGIVVETVEQARLVLTGAITEPLSARADGIVGLNTLVTVRATVENIGQAGTRGNARIKLTLPDDPALPPGQDYRTAEDSIKIAGAGNTVTWQFRARSLPSVRAETIRLRLLESYPSDANTDSAATVLDNEVTISIQTEPKRLIVQTLPAGQGPVAQGQSSSLLMRLKLTNEGNVNSSNILLRALTWHVLNRDNKPLNASQVMKALRVVDTNNPSRVLASLTTIPASDSLRVPFVPADTLLGGVPAIVDVVVDVADKSGEAFRLAFKRAADVEAIDQDSGDPVEIIFKNEDGSDVAANQVVSAKRVIAEADFQKSFYNYPNPFDPDQITADHPQGGTYFNYMLTQASEVEFRIYTLLGELVYARSYTSSDAEGRPSQSPKRLFWDGRNGKGERVLNGVYLAMLKINGGMATTKVAVLKK